VKIVHKNAVTKEVGQVKSSLPCYGIILYGAITIIEQKLEVYKLLAFACIHNKNKPPAMQVCSQIALASSKNLLCYNKCRFANRTKKAKEVSRWIKTV